MCTRVVFKHSPLSLQAWSSSALFQASPEFYSEETSNVTYWPRVSPEWSQKIRRPHRCTVNPVTSPSAGLELNRPFRGPLGGGYNERAILFKCTEGLWLQLDHLSTWNFTLWTFFFSSSVACYLSVCLPFYLSPFSTLCVTGYHEFQNPGREWRKVLSRMSPRVYARRRREQEAGRGTRRPGWRGYVYLRLLELYAGVRYCKVLLTATEQFCLSCVWKNKPSLRQHQELYFLNLTFLEGSDFRYQSEAGAHFRVWNDAPPRAARTCRTALRIYKQRPEIFPWLYF